MAVSHILLKKKIKIFDRSCGIMHVTRTEEAFKTTHHLLYVGVHEQLYLTVLCVGSNMTVKTRPTVLLKKTSS